MATKARRHYAVRRGVLVALPYGRVSTEEQSDEGLSLPTQRQSILEYVARKGYVAGEWREDVESGLKPSRKGYQALLAEARALVERGQACCVIVTRVDRLGRRLVELARVREELAELGVPIHYVREGGELPEVVANMLGSLAQEESRRNGARVSEVIGRCSHLGYWFPGRLLWGYVARKATPDERAAGAPSSVLEVDTLARPYVEAMFARAAKGEALRAIARWLSTLPAEVQRGRHFTHTSVRRLLQSPTYCARTPDGKPGKWEPIITPEVWSTVQARIAGQAPALPKQASERYLLTGLVRCPRCGARMHGTTGGAGTVNRYRCSATSSIPQGNAPLCNYSIAAHLLDPAVLAEVEPVVLGAPHVLRDEFEAEARALAERPNDAAREAERQRLQALKDTSEVEISGLSRELARKVISDRAYQIAVADAMANLETAEQGLAALDQAEADEPARDLLAMIGSADFWRETWQDGTLEERRRILAELVTSIRPMPNPSRRQAASADVSWTLTGQYIRALLAPATTS